MALARRDERARDGHDEDEELGVPLDGLDQRRVTRVPGLEDPAEPADRSQADEEDREEGHEPPQQRLDDRLALGLEALGP